MDLFLWVHISIELKASALQETLHMEACDANFKFHTKVAPPILLPTPPEAL